MSTGESGSGTWTGMNAVFQDANSRDINGTSIQVVAARLNGNVNLIESWMDKSEKTANGALNSRRGFFGTDF